jgi:hypothetical protein
VTPLQLADAIDAGLARTKRRGDIAMELTGPRLLGHEGRYLGEGEFGPRYGYTRRQCLAIKRWMQSGD